MLAAIGQGVSIALLLYGGLLFFAHQDVLDDLPGEKGQVERGRRFARSDLVAAAYWVHERAAAAAVLAFVFIVVATVH